MGVQENSEMEADTDLQASMEREISELATLQEQWVNHRDLGDLIGNREECNLRDHANETSNTRTMSTLLIAQHEWRKLLDGSKGIQAGCPI
jgi:hypothetical protein